MRVSAPRGERAEATSWAGAASWAAGGSDVGSGRERESCLGRAREGKEESWARGAAVLARVGFEGTSGLGQETGLGCFFLSYFKPLKLFEFKFKFEFKP